jgi:hypothetical protein
MSSILDSLFGKKEEPAISPLSQVTAEDAMKRAKIADALCGKRYALEAAMKQPNITEEQLLLTHRELTEEKEKMTLFGINEMEYAVYVARCETLAEMKAQTPHEASSV